MWSLCVDCVGKETKKEDKIQVVTTTRVVKGMAVYHHYCTISGNDSAGCRLY